VETIAQASARSCEALDCLVRFQIGSRTAGFLSRLAELYIWGFDSSVYVVDRSVLEAALRERIPDDRVRQLINRGNQRQFVLGLTEHIDAAFRLGLLTTTLAADAHHIRQMGNEAVTIHLKPTVSNRHQSK